MIKQARGTSRQFFVSLAVSVATGLPADRSASRDGRGGASRFGEPDVRRGRDDASGLPDRTGITAAVVRIGTRVFDRPEGPAIVPRSPHHAQRAAADADLPCGVV